MTTTAHTAGPWVYEYSPYTSQDGEEIPTFKIHGAEKVCDTNESQSCEEQEANARLIAGSPQLLEALSALVRMVTMTEYAFAMENVLARAALTDATGAYS